jgi:hypothetical protein
MRWSGFGGSEPLSFRLDGLRPHGLAGGWSGIGLSVRVCVLQD